MFFSKIVRVVILASIAARALAASPVFFAFWRVEGELWKGVLIYLSDGASGVFAGGTRGSGSPMTYIRHVFAKESVFLSIFLLSKNANLQVY